MKRRSLIMRAAFAFIASLAFATPSQATSYTIQVTETFFVQNTHTPTPVNSISSIQFTFSGLNGLTNVTDSGNGVTTSFVNVTPGISSNAGAQTVTLTYSPQVFLAAGSVTFDTISNTNNIVQLQQQIKLTGVTITAAAGPYTTSFVGPTFTVVPEPASMSLLGIGMSGLFAFRRYFRRNRYG